MIQWNDQEILRYLGYRNQVVSDSICSLIEECKQEVGKIAKPKHIYNSFSLEQSQGRICFAGIDTKSKSLSNNLRDCDEVIVFGATLGVAVDMLLQKYTKIQVSKAVIMQAVAVSLLEAYCDEVNKQLKEYYLENNRYLRPRFSPGYGDFSLEVQPQIFRILELNKKLGVSLTDRLLMTPTKSITALIGVSGIPRECSVSGCEACNNFTCEYRR